MLNETARAHQIIIKNNMNEKKEKEKPKAPIKKLINKNNTLWGCLLNIFASSRTSKLPTQSNNFYIPSLTPSLLVLLYICRHHHHLNRYEWHELTNKLWKPVTKFMKEFSPLTKNEFPSST